MIRNPHARRGVSLVLIAAGGVLLFLAPEDYWQGVLLLGLAVVLELIGTLVQRSAARPSA